MFLNGKPFQSCFVPSFYKTGFFFVRLLSFGNRIFQIMCNLSGLRQNFRITQDTVIFRQQLLIGQKSPASFLNLQQQCFLTVNTNSLHSLFHTAWRHMTLCKKAFPRYLFRRKIAVFQCNCHIFCHPTAAQQPQEGITFYPK